MDVLACTLPIPRERGEHVTSFLAHGRALGRDLDKKLLEALLQPSRTVSFPGLSSRERRWMHCRAATLGLTSASTPAAPNTGRKDFDPVLHIGKPSDEWSVLDRIRNGPPPPAADRQLGSTIDLDSIKKKKKERNKAAKALKREKMKKWRTHCEKCWEELTAYDALYHWSGLGPLCWDCIQKDPELMGAKWEAK
ncbi:hypothetical protein HK102_002261, partial [Quaeritorhiza haematococci]